MFAPALLVAVVVVGVAYLSARRSRETGPDEGSAPRMPAGDLPRWVDAGLITADQAEAIVAFETTRRPVRARPIVAPTVEALAYAGGVLLTVGAGMLVARIWDDVGTAAHLAVIGAAAAVAGVVGALVGEAEPVAWRLRGFLWALSAGGVAAAAGLVVFEGLDASGPPVALAAAGVGGLSSLAYWRLHDRPLPHLLTFVGLAVSIGVSISWVGGDGMAAVIGSALWALGVTWAWLARADRVPPALVGLPLGVVLTLVASGIAGGEHEWLSPVLGLATAGGWVAIGTARHEPTALAPGVAGVFVYLPWAIGYFFGETLGAPTIAMLSGAALLGVVTLLVRRDRDGAGHHPWRGHPGPVPR